MSNRPVSSLSSVKQALLGIADPSGEGQRLATPIGVIGMACRFPGAPSLADFWGLLVAGGDAVGPVPADRWNADDLYDARPGQPGKSIQRVGGFIGGIDQFDPAFFGLSVREAQSMDPQQRIALEIATQALVSAGYPVEPLPDASMGVFMGVAANDYLLLRRTGRLNEIDAHTGTGTSHSILTGRLSYFLGACGPSVAIDTACSSSLVALHLACQSLESRDCRVALVGGISLMLTPEVTIGLSQAGMLSPEGRCRTFDDGADGYVRGEGCGIVVLKPLRDALRDGDRVMAVVRGTAVNQDGRSNGLTAPNGQAQEALITRALTRAGVAGSDIEYVEAHGTGTPMGDPVEVQALSNVLMRDRPPGSPCWLGSVKTNIGHLEAAAGIAGLIKTVLAIRHHVVPAHLHIERLNPRLKLSQTQFVVPEKSTPWLGRGKSLYAGVSSFGFCGTNAHVVLESAPGRTVPPTGAPGRDRHLLAVSAKSGWALNRLAVSIADRMRNGEPASVADLCHSANRRAGWYPRRIAVSGSTLPELADRLVRAADDLAAAPGPASTPDGRIAFLFSGQGSQYEEMGRTLFEGQPVFRESLRLCDTLAQPFLGQSLLSLLYPLSATDRALTSRTEYAQPLLFAVGYALAMVWSAWGVRPCAVAGHSLGEYIAACFAGVLDLEDALRLVVERGRLVQGLPSGGAMLAIFASASQCFEAIEPYRNELSVAAFNGSHVVVSGPADALQRLRVTLAQEGTTSRFLDVSHAFHSPLMRPVVPEFAAFLSTLSFHAPRLPLVSNTTGDRVAADSTLDAEYWISHLTEPVQFKRSIQTLCAMNVKLFIEIGPDGVLTPMGRACDIDHKAKWIPSIKKGAGNWNTILDACAIAYTEGATIDWKEVNRGSDGVAIDLPDYPFEPRRIRIPAFEWSVHGKGPDGGHEGDPVRLAGAFSGQRVILASGMEVFQTLISASVPDYLGDHRIGGDVILPGAYFLAELLASAGILQDGRKWATEGVTFHTPVNLSDGDCLAQLSIAKAERDSRQVLIHTRNRRATEGEWVLNAHAALVSANRQGTRQPSAIEQIASRAAKAVGDRDVMFDEIISRQQFYDGLKEHGVLLGPAFQRCADVWRSDGVALARLRPYGVAGAAGGAAFAQIHPTMIDACFQLFGAALDVVERRRLAAGGMAVVPIGIDAFEWSGDSQAELWAYLEIVSDDSAAKGMYSGNVVLLDDGGDAVGSLIGVAMAAIRHAERRPADVAIELFTPAWRPAPDSNGQAVVSRGHWLLVSDSMGGEVLCGAIEAAGHVCTKTVCSRVFAGTEPGCIAFDPAAPDDASRAIRVATATNGPLTGVVYLRTADESHCRHPNASSGYGKARADCQGLLHLYQALAEEGGVAKLWIVTEGRPHGGGSYRPPPLVHAPLWGLARVIALESPAMFGGLVELSDPTSPAEQTALLREFTAPAGRQLMLRNSQRFESNWAHVQPDTPAAAQCFHAEGTYLITGGLGALGSALVEWLIVNGAKNLALVGRKPAVPEQEAVLSKARLRGVTILTLRGDVADTNDLARLLGEVRAALPPLRGVFHLAGVLDDAALALQSWSRFEGVLRPKVDGAWLLHKLTLCDQLDHFVLFSSMASVTGSFGQGSYAAGNAFLDALADERKSMGLPALSVNWGPWADVGMAAVRDTQSLWTNSGLSLLPPQRALELLGQLMAGVCHAQVCVVATAPSTPDVPQPAIAGANAGLGKVTPEDHARLLSLGSDSMRTAVCEKVQAVLSEMLRMGPDELDIDLPLPSVGLDSLLAVELKHRLESIYGVPLRLTSLISEMTVRALGDHIACAIESGRSGRHAAGPAGRDAVEIPSEAAIANMSEPELDAMLAVLMPDEESR